MTAEKTIEWSILLDNDCINKKINYRACSESRNWRKVTHQHNTLKSALFGEEGTSNLTKSNYSAMALFNTNSILYRDRKLQYGEPYFAVIWTDDRKWAAIIDHNNLSLVPIDVILELESDINKQKNNVKHTKLVDVKSLLSDYMEQGLKLDFLEHTLKYEKTKITDILEYWNLNNTQIVKIKSGDNAIQDELKDFFTHFENEVSKSFNDLKSRRKRLEKLVSKSPTKSKKSTFVYERNPDVVAERLHLAGGKCESESCQGYEAFLRKSNNTPYLEVHHKILLSEGGLDSVDNTIALCPNCHRQKHYG